MFRKLIIITAILAMAGMAQAQNFFTEPANFGTATILGSGNSGFITGWDYHNNVLYTNNQWIGEQWGMASDGARDHANAVSGVVGDDMCSMGVAVHNESGVFVDLYNRFYEHNAQGVHASGGETFTVNFDGVIGTNIAVDLGLVNDNTDGWHFMNANGVTNTNILVAKQVFMRLPGDPWGSAVTPQVDDDHAFKVRHTNCTKEFRFQLVVTLPQHTLAGSWDMPFIFCPTPVL